MTQTLRPFTHLGDMPIETFLRDYWQKKPLLIRQALPNFESPLSADELAGLCLEDDVISRLIIETPQSSPFNSEWNVTHGPVPEDIFETLPENYWSLLVQHVDQLSPEVNQLLNLFRFIPNWRLDDVMISYAPDKGGVGPHFDYYDVFLLQGHGQRRWRLGQQCTSKSPMLANAPMKVLTEFDVQEDWVLNPGDILYVPPGLAHWGTAVGESITYSVGFRAPSHQDIVLDFSQEVASKIEEDNRYQDQFLTANKNAGEITGDAIEQLKHILQTYMQDEQALAQWLGKTMTQLNPGMVDEAENTIEPEEMANTPFTLSPFARATFYRADSNSEAYIFINGEVYSGSLELANTLSNYLPIDWLSCSDTDKLILETLAQQYLLVSLS